MNRRILVIDDDVAIQNLLSHHLANGRTEVCAATDGESGVELAREMQPDLILLDIDMPGITGHEVCRRLQSDAMTRTIPIAFITSAASTREKIAALDEGAIDYIVKPFDPEEVAARTRAAFRTKSRLDHAATHTLIDPLTGLGSRAAFERQMSTELARTRRSAEPLACILLEPDRLDHLALQEGFAVCDKVLLGLANVLKDTCREEDCVFRFSEHQFAILAPNVNIENVARLGERLRTTIQSQPALCPQSTTPITISLGLAISRFSFGNSLTEVAEAALQQAKAAGGDIFVPGCELAELRLAN